MGDNRLDSKQTLWIKKETELIPALLLIGRAVAVAVDGAVDGAVAAAAAAAAAASAAKEVLGSQGR